MLAIKPLRSSLSFSSASRKIKIESLISPFSPAEFFQNRLRQVKSVFLRFLQLTFKECMLRAFLPAVAFNLHVRVNQAFHRRMTYLRRKFIRNVLFTVYFQDVMLQKVHFLISPAIMFLMYSDMFIPHLSADFSK